MVQRLYTQPAPDPGTDWTFVLPGGYFYKILSVLSRLATSPTVGFRTVDWLIDDETHTLMAIPSANVQEEANTITYSWVSALSLQAESSDSKTMTTGLPDKLYLPAGYRIRVATDSIDVADQWSDTIVWVDDGIPDPMLVAYAQPSTPAAVPLVVL